MKKLLYAVFLFFLGFGSMNAQLQRPPALSQYMFNPMSSNPGYAGFHDMLIVSNLFRSQLTSGFRNYTNTFNVHSSLPIDHLGAGLNVTFDQVGITSSIGLDLAFSYQFIFGANQLSFGLQGSFFHASSDFSKLEYSGGSDGAYAQEFIPTSGGTINKPNFGTGVMYRGRKFFGGVSVPRILAMNQAQESVFQSGDSTLSAVRNARFNSYFTASFGTILQASNRVELKPSFMFKYVRETGMLLDLNFSALFNQVIWGGISFRNAVQNPQNGSQSLWANLNSIALMGQLQVNEKLKVGFSYDIPVNREVFLGLQGYKYPFELMVNYNLAVFEVQGVHTFLF